MTIVLADLPGHGEAIRKARELCELAWQDLTGSCRPDPPEQTFARLERLTRKLDHRLAQRYPNGIIGEAQLARLNNQGQAEFLCLGKPMIWHRPAGSPWVRLGNHQHLQALGMLGAGIEILPTGHPEPTVSCPVGTEILLSSDGLVENLMRLGNDWSYATADRHVLEDLNALRSTGNLQDYLEQMWSMTQARWAALSSADWPADDFTLVFLRRLPNA